MIDTLNDNTIRARSCTDCYVCGARGKILYRDLRDRLFGLPGEWNLKTCSNPKCRLVWLDPMPLEEDIGKAYQNYYTHSENNSDNQDKGLKETTISNFGQVYRAMLRVTPSHRERKKRSLMYLDQVTPGKLLEVGCGNGHLLAQMHARGWEVEGQEVDPKAAAYARDAYRFPVHLGALEELAFSDATFDAIIMNHVIEHVHDPIAFLMECYRVLKANGVLVAVTPNIESYGHKRFGSNWRGLEPPRHIHLFSSSSLHACAKKAGDGSIEIWTTPANVHAMFVSSRDIRTGDTQKTRIKWPLLLRYTSVVFEFWELFLGRGEELVLKVVKT